MQYTFGRTEGGTTEQKYNENSASIHHSISSSITSSSIMDVTLIVKASNQQCEDLTIKCEPSWTIRRLKGHLTEVYPGKPSSDEQKLIYSGQLLGDSVVLKDVLRQYDGQQAHTVHLVFTPKNSYYGSGGSGGSGSKSNGRNGNSNSSGSSSTGTSSSARMSTNSSSATSSVASTSANASSGGTPAGNNNSSSSRAGDYPMEDGVGGDGLRQRSSMLQTRPALRTLPGPPPFMEQTAALQSLVQQTYMQYLNQYINMINEQGGVNALYSATGMPMVGGTGNTVTGTPVVPSVPFVPLTYPATTAAGAFPNMAYYPCMSAAAHMGGLPSASTIPTSSLASAASGSSGPGTNTSFLPSPAMPSTSGSSEQQQTPTALPPGGASSPSPSSSSDASGVGSASATVTTAAGQAPGSSSEVAAAAPAQAAGAPQDGGAGADAAAPARARRFPNIVVEEQENNDWLDVFFSMCRVGILMTVIYLYSSPKRCLMVLVIGLMLYFKKHLDRVYQALDWRVARLMTPAERNAAQPQQPVAVAAQPNNNVPEQQANQPREPNPAAGAMNAAEEQPIAGPSSVRPTGRRETEGEVAAVPRPRTGPGSRAPAAEANEGGANAETEPLLERQPNATNGSEGTPNAEQPAAEGQRMTFNDMTSFLSTLVITFFTSIIPDTPAA